MKRREAENHLKKKVKIILTNNFHYTGIIEDLWEDTLILRDKFGNSVSIKLSNIMIFEEVQDGN